MKTITEELIEAGHLVVDDNICPKCWEEAYVRSLEDGVPRVDHYQRVVEEAESGRWR